MSSNLITDINNIENFENPGYILGDTNNKTKSFSALNVGDKNLHNSIYSNQLGKSKFIVKRNNKFENVNKIDTHWYNENIGSAPGCLDECKEMNQCSAYTFDKSDKSCSLYNTVPNKFTQDSNVVSGYKVDQDYQMNKLNDEQIVNIQDRVGSMYLQKKFDIKNNDEKHDLNKCIKGVIVGSKVSMKLLITVPNTRWSGSKDVNETYLTYKGNNVSEAFFLNLHEFPRGKSTWVWVDYIMKSSYFDGVCFSIGNYDGIRINRIKLQLVVNQSMKEIVNISGGNKWIKNSSHCFKFPKKIDLNNISFSSDLEVSFQGPKEKAITKTIKSEETNMIDTILKNNDWDISADISVNEKSNVWRNIFHCGTGNGERAPALWIIPNKSWKFHFRINTSRNKNDGFDFWIPKDFRNYNEQLHINITYKKYETYKTHRWRWYRWTARYWGFIVTATVNGIYAGSRNFRSITFIPLPKRKFYIKCPWYNKSGYSVENITFAYRNSIQLLSGYDTANRSQESIFNRNVANLPVPYYITRIGWHGYKGDYESVVYKRKTSSAGINMWKLFTTDWFDETNNIKNKFHVDFDIYSSVENAKDGIGAWKFCNFNDPGIGFPRDCGINKAAGGQWMSQSRGGKKTWILYLHKNEKSFLNTNLNNIVKAKVTGFEADPKCVYRNISAPKNKFNRNLTLLGKKDISYSSSNNEIEDSHKNQMKILESNKDFNISLQNNIPLASVETSKLNFIQELNTEKGNSIIPEDNNVGLDSLVNGNSNSNSIEKFENNNTSIYSNKTKNYLMLFGIILLLVIMYYYYS